MAWIIVGLLAALALAGCGQQPTTAADTRRMERDVSLEQQLLALGYQDLFQRLNHDSLERVWAAPEAPTRLAALALDRQADHTARLLAAEILFYKQPGYPPPEAVAALAQVYAHALSQAHEANRWGLPGQLDGPLGQHMVGLGEPAVSSLLPLLVDRRSIPYAGSQEAMLGNSYEYRVKDFAAFFISQIRKLPYQVHQSPQQRDQEIAALQQAL